MAINTEIEKRGLSLTSFPVVSLFLGLFSILTLFFCNFFDHRMNDSSFIDTMFIINVMCLLFTSYSVIKERFNLKYKIFELSHLNSIIFLVVIIILSFILYQLDWSFCRFYYDPIPNWHIKILIGLTILNPILHFIIMFFLAFWNTRVSVKRYLEQLKKFEDDLDSFIDTDVAKAKEFAEEVKNFAVS